MLQKIFFPLTLLMLTACGEQPATPTSTTQTASTTELVGCYSVHKDSPAQIKISHDAGYAMQMKEPDGASETWDKPEPLVALTFDKAWEFFKTNTLDVQSADLSHVIARPDGMMVLAKINPTVRNVNPMLDSDYVMQLFGAVNTIYQVPCDEVRLEMKPDIHGVHGH